MPNSLREPLSVFQFLITQSTGAQMSSRTDTIQCLIHRFPTTSGWTVMMEMSRVIIKLIILTRSRSRTVTI